jgi:hypothetical protein
MRTSTRHIAPTLNRVSAVIFLPSVNHQNEQLDKPFILT